MTFFLIWLREVFNLWSNKVCHTKYEWKFKIASSVNQKHHKIEQEKLFILVKDQTSLIGAKWQPDSGV
jgi:hypothetical protein